jgi:hypothetical protein
MAENMLAQHPETQEFVDSIYNTYGFKKNIVEHIQDIHRIGSNVTDYFNTNYTTTRAHIISSIEELLSTTQIQAIQSQVNTTATNQYQRAMTASNRLIADLKSYIYIDNFTIIKNIDATQHQLFTSAQNRIIRTSHKLNAWIKSIVEKYHLPATLTIITYSPQHEAITRLSYNPANYDCLLSIMIDNKVLDWHESSKENDGYERIQVYISHELGHITHYDLMYKKLIKNYVDTLKDSKYYYSAKKLHRSFKHTIELHADFWALAYATESYTYILKNCIEKIATIISDADNDKNWWFFNNVSSHPAYLARIMHYIALYEYLEIEKIILAKNIF